MCYIYIKGKRFDMLVHRLVAQTFIPNPENKKEVNHKNGIKTDNKVENLEWVTPKENIIHAYKSGLMKKTFKDCYNSSLTEDEVIEIRKRLYKKDKQRFIAKKFNVSENIISSIKHGRSYKGVGLLDNGLAINLETIDKQ